MKKRRSDAGLARVHGHTSKHNCSRTYRSYMSMKQRCENPKNPGFHWYGGRGIAICERWLESFENFLADMGERPNGMSLDRINVNGNYEPSNCRWATPKEQTLNRRKTTWVRPHRDLTGASFGYWRVMKFANAKPRPKWICRCECGTVKEVITQTLVDLKSGSCGCLARERFKLLNPVKIRWARHRARAAA